MGPDIRHGHSHQASASTDGNVPKNFRRHATSMLSVHTHAFWPWMKLETSPWPNATLISVHAWCEDLGIQHYLYLYINTGNATGALDVSAEHRSVFGPQ